MALKGKKLTEEHKRKIGESNRDNPIHKITGKINGLLNRGRLKTNKHRKALSNANNSGWFKSGEQHPLWNGGITPIRKKLYQSSEYKLWRKSVFERDNYTCVWCGQRGYKLEADHIKPWCDYPELRFAIDNGRTLCVNCHKTTDTYGHHKIYG